MTERFKPHAAVLVFLVKDNSMLLLRRCNTGWADGQYTVPSGHIDENEPATTAAVRETKEEIGVDIALQDLHFAHVLHRKNNENNQTYIDFFFVTKKWSGTPENKELDKCDEIGWFDVNHLPENTIPFISNTLQKYLKNEGFSETGWSDNQDIPPQPEA